MPNPRGVRTSACAIAAMLQNTIANAKPSFVPITSRTRPTISRPIAYAAWNDVTM
jgi:hypothetical protein